MKRLALNTGHESPATKQVKTESIVNSAMSEEFSDVSEEFNNEKFEECDIIIFHSPWVIV